MLKATDGYPLNFGFSGKGNTSDPKVLESVLKAGAAGFKLHEDWGTTPAAIDAALTFAAGHDANLAEVEAQSRVLEHGITAVESRAEGLQSSGIGRAIWLQGDG